MTSPIIPQKKCACCKEFYPPTSEFFAKDNARKDGLYPYCKICSQKKWVDYLAQNPDKHEDRKLKGRNREAKKRKSSDYNEKRRPKRNLKLENKRRSIRRENDPLYREHENKKMRERRAAKGDYWRLKSRLYSAKRRSQMGHEHYTTEDIKMLFALQNGNCWWCGKHTNGIFHIDHWIPLSRGGNDKVDNIVISCPLCNERKHDKLPLEWLKELQ